MGLLLGIDTSCYTTSLALMDTGNNLVADKRKLLEVPTGTRGLQQSNAVFQHIQNLKGLSAQLWEIPGRRRQIVAVSASTKPRPIEGSYMPVFTVSESYGQTLAALLGVPFITTSHQEGHIAAGKWSVGKFRFKKFLAVHLSGGTTELLMVQTEDDRVAGFDIKVIGGTQDLNAGQFVDRVATSMGLSFPGGPALEDLARSAQGKLTIPSSVRDFEISFSGPETRAQQLVKQGEDPAEIARAVERCIASSLEKLLAKAVRETGIKNVLMVGGVNANYFLRSRLRERLEHPSSGVKLYFAEPPMSSDNAVGVAAIGVATLNKKSKVR